MSETILSLGVVFIASLCNTVFGFGGGLVSIPLLSLMLGVKKAVLLALTLQVATGMLISKTRHHTDWGMIKRISPALFAGIALGTLILEKANNQFLNYFLALFIYLFIAKSRFFPDIKLGVSSSRRGLYFAGIITGTIGGLTGTAGPVIVMLLSEITKDKVIFRANIIALLFITNLTRLVTAGARGLFDASLIQLSLLCLPLIGLAMVSGQKLHSSVSPRVYENGVQLILLISATLLLAKG
ncbi:MAG: sulfite exporter TauE/SafE family protein [bacterium]|nr:sulfite exporter TauE/SafE family protein [bacterium]